MKDVNASSRQRIRVGLYPSDDLTPDLLQLAQVVLRSLGHAVVTAWLCRTDPSEECLYLSAYWCINETNNLVLSSAQSD